MIQFLAGAAADRIDPPLPTTSANLNHHREGNTSSDDIKPVAAAAAAATTTRARARAGLTDEEAIHESLETLRSIFGSENVPEPIVSKVTRWRNDPWSCGSYSFAKVGSSPSMYDEIASPLGGGGGGASDNSCLLFAGEHTSKHFHSTVHGAWETGQREAERIFERIRVADL